MNAILQQKMTVRGGTEVSIGVRANDSSIRFKAVVSYAFIFIVSPVEQMVADELFQQR